MKISLIPLLFASVTAENLRRDRSDLHDLVASLAEKVGSLEQEVEELKRARRLQEDCMMEYDPLEQACKLNNTLVLGIPEVEIVPDVAVTRGKHSEEEEVEPGVRDVVLGAGAIALKVLGPTVLKGMVDVEGESLFQDAVFMDGVVEINQKVTIFADVDVCGFSTFNSDVAVERMDFCVADDSDDPELTVTGELLAEGDVTIEANLDVKEGDVEFEQLVTISGEFDCTGLSCP